MWGGRVPQPPKKGCERAGDKRQRRILRELNLGAEHITVLLSIWRLQGLTMDGKKKSSNKVSTARRRRVGRH